MKNIVTLVLFSLIYSFVYSQKIDLKYTKVLVCYRDTVELKTNSKLNFDKYNFILQSDDDRLYSFIVPNSEFDVMNFRVFRDTGLLLKDDKDTASRTVVYESLFSFPTPVQIGIKLNTNLNDSLIIIKRDKSSIIFLK